MVERAVHKLGGRLGIRVPHALQVRGARGRGVSCRVVLGRRRAQQPVTPALSELAARGASLLSALGV